MPPTVIVPAMRDVPSMSSSKTAAPSQQTALEAKMEANSDLKPLPCPFCGSSPHVLPTHPLSPNNGHAWGEVRCCNSGCPAQPRVRDGAVTDELGGEPEPYQREAIRRWNRRYA